MRAMRAALKAPMPKTPRKPSDFFSQSLRLHPADLEWLQAEAAERKSSLTEVAASHLDDRRTMYSLPREQVDRLLEDARTQNYWYPERVGQQPRIDRRSYIQSVLVNAHKSLMREALDTTSGKPKVTPVQGDEALAGGPEKDPTTLRMPLELAAFLKEESFFVGSWSEVVRGIFADHRLLFGLNVMHVRMLNGDAQRLGLKRRDYIQHLLAQRYDEVLREDLRKEREAQSKKK